MKVMTMMMMMMDHLTLWIRQMSDEIDCIQHLRLGQDDGVIPPQLRAPNRKKMLHDDRWRQALYEKGCHQLRIRRGQEGEDQIFLEKVSGSCWTMREILQKIPFPARTI